MASADIIRKALMALMRRKASVTGKPNAAGVGQPELPGIPPASKPPIPNNSPLKAESDFLGTTDNELMGIAEPRLNEYQRAAKDTTPTPEGVELPGSRRVRPEEQDVEGFLSDDLTIEDLLLLERSLSEQQAAIRAKGGTKHAGTVRRAGGLKRTNPARDVTPTKARGKVDASTQAKVDKAAKKRFASPEHREAAQKAKKVFHDRSTSDKIDFEGTKREEEIKRIQKIIKEDGDNDVSDVVSSSVRSAEINAEVQDIITRFKELFDVEKLKKANLNDPIVSQLWDKWQELSTNARGARRGDAAALHRIRNIDAWLHKGLTKDQLELFPDTIRTNKSKGRKSTKAEKLETKGLGDTRGSNQELGKRAFGEADNDAQTIFKDDIVSDYASPDARANFPDADIPRIEEGIERTTGDINELGPLIRTLMNRTKQQSGFDPSQIPKGLSKGVDAQPGVPVSYQDFINRRSKLDAKLKEILKRRNIGQ